MNKIIALNNYTQFHCKCGDCRNTCCKLWHITLSEDEYFKTESLDCSDSLKEIINRSLSLIPSHLASQNKYAEINLKYDGYCPLINNSGYCSLQCECGVTSLPSICNNFPRSKRQIFDTSEIALSCACEKVLELSFVNNKLELFNTQEPSSYFSLQLSSLPKDQLSIKKTCLNFMQNAEPFSKIFIDIKNYLESISSKINIKNETWDNEEIVFLNNMFQELFNRDLYFADIKPFFISKSYSEMLSLEESLFNKHPQCKQYIKNILTTHMFYTNFPFCDNDVDYKNSLIGLMTTYHIVSYLFINYFDDKDLNKLIDVLTFAFRTIEHTSFYHNCHVLYNKYLLNQ